MAELNKILGVVVGQYGEPIQVQVVDKNAVAVDISSYTTKTITLRDPNGINTRSYAASFVSTGSDGKLQFTPVDGDINVPGNWEGQVLLVKTSVRTLTQVFIIPVEKRLDVI